VLEQQHKRTKRLFIPISRKKEKNGHSYREEKKSTARRGKSRESTKWDATRKSRRAKRRRFPAMTRNRPRFLLLPKKRYSPILDHRKGRTSPRPWGKFPQTERPLLMMKKRKKIGRVFSDILGIQLGACSKEKKKACCRPLKRERLGKNGPSML